MTRKVSTTCSRNARPGSWMTSESPCKPDSAMSLPSILSYSCGRVISLRFISNEAWITETRPDLEPVVLGFPYVLLLVRPYKRTGPSAKRSVNQLDTADKIAHSPNAPPMCPECKNTLSGITLFPILTTEGRVVCQSICATHPPELSELVSELEEDEAHWLFPGFHTVVCPPINLDSV